MAVELQQKDPRGSHITTTPAVAHVRCGRLALPWSSGTEVSFPHAMRSTSSFHILSVVWYSLSIFDNPFHLILLRLKKKIFICTNTFIFGQNTSDTLRMGDEHARVSVKGQRKTASHLRHSRPQLDFTPWASLHTLLMNGCDTIHHSWLILICQVVINLTNLYQLHRCQRQFDFITYVLILLYFLRR